MRTYIEGDTRYSHRGRDEDPHPMYSKERKLWILAPSQLI